MTIRASTPGASAAVSGSGSSPMSRKQPPCRVLPAPPGSGQGGLVDQCGLPEVDRARPARRQVPRQSPRTSPAAPAIPTNRSSRDSARRAASKTPETNRRAAWPMAASRRSRPSSFARLLQLVSRAQRHLLLSTLLPPRRRDGWWAWRSRSACSTQSRAPTSTALSSRSPGLMSGESCHGRHSRLGSRTAPCDHLGRLATAVSVAAAATGAVGVPDQVRQVGIALLISHVPRQHRHQPGPGRAQRLPGSLRTAPRRWPG